MKTEKAFALLFVIGILFKLLHWPGGNILLVFSLSVLALIYFPLAFYFFSYKGIKNQNLAFSIIAGMFLAMAPIGIEFKLLRWPMANIYCIIGIIGSATIIAIAFSLKGKKEAGLDAYYLNIIKRAAVLLPLTLGAFLLPSSALNYLHRTPTEYQLRQEYLKDTTNLESKRALQEYLYLKDSLPN